METEGGKNKDQKPLFTPLYRWKIFFTLDEDER
jgi:hypothetical protein